MLKLIGIEEELKTILDKEKIISRERYDDVIQRLLDNSKKIKESERDVSEIIE